MNAASDRAEPENQKDKMKRQKNETGAGNPQRIWKISPNGGITENGACIICNSVESLVTYGGKPINEGYGKEKADENRNLISAAPELLNLVKAWAMSEPLGTHADACHAAIAKAEGRAE